MDAARKAWREKGDVTDCAAVTAPKTLLKRLDPDLKLVDASLHVHAADKPAPVWDQVRVSYELPAHAGATRTVERKLMRCECGALARCHPQLLKGNRAIRKHEMRAKLRAARQKQRRRS